MSPYGILIVDTSWLNHDSVEIDKTAYLRHQDKLIKGAHALIFVREPIDAVVAEAEITGDIIQTETQPPDPYFNPSIPANIHLERELNEIHSQTDASIAANNNQVMAKTYRVPLNITRMKGQTPQIPLTHLQKILGSDFSVFDETWIALSKKQYDTITTEWTKEQVQ